MNNNLTAKSILKYVGGSGNIEKSWHCATRIRVVPKNEDKVSMEDLKRINGVIGVVKSGDQFQMVIGNQVSTVYNQFQSLLVSDPELEDTEGVKSHDIHQNNKTGNVVTHTLSKMLSTVVGCITPLIPVLVAGGMGKCLVLLLEMFGVLNKTSSTYTILFFIFNSAFYFLPVFISMAAAKQFKTNAYLATLVGASLINPTFITLIQSHKPVTLMGIPVILFNYSSSIIPAIVAIWALSHVERFFENHLWNSVKGFMSPLLSILIIVPLTIILIGPAMSIVSQGISLTMFFLTGKLGFLSIPLFALIYPWMVTTGMHSALGLAGLQAVTKSGVDPFTRALTLLHGITQASASFAIAFKTKNKVLRATAISAAMTAVFSGITEPCLYGATLKLRKPMYACMIGGFAGGLFAGIRGLNAYVFMTPGLISLPMWINPKTPNELTNLFTALIAALIAGLVTFVVTLVIGFEDIPELDNDIHNKKVGMPSRISDNVIVD